MNHFMCKGFAGVVPQSPVLPDKAAMQEQDRKTIIDSELDSRREKTRLPGGIPGGNPVCPETVLLPGQSACFPVQNTGNRRSLCDQLREFRILVPERGQFLMQDSKPIRKLLNGFSRSKKQTGGIKFR